MAQPKVIVVGGGAAGILAAWRAATLGARVTIFEKTNRIGTKILVSGGGKCNIAHAGEIEDVLRAFRPNEARFLRPACYRLRNTQIVELFTSRGLRVYTRPDGRVFPEEATAKEVVAILRDYLQEAGVEIRFESPVTGLIVENGVAQGVRYRRAQTRSRTSEGEGGYRARTAKNLLRELDSVVEGVEGEEREFRADRVIVCTGGSSYPNSGTTGDAWGWAREVGHTVHRIRAALAPIYLQLDPEPADRAGVALRGVVLRARQSKEIARWTGDLLFTHQGISGPAALGVSRVVAEHEGEVTLEVDLVPAKTEEALRSDLLDFTSNHPGRRVAGFLDDLLPDRLVGDVLRAAEIEEELTNARLDKKRRNRLVAVLKGWPLGRVRHVPLEKGEVVAGGISLDEVDPQTMRSRLVENLLLCGEALDIAGPVGGYNLQAAFATGYVAGESAAN